jgi:hypothetical protein
MPDLGALRCWKWFLLLILLGVGLLPGCNRGPQMGHVRGYVFYKDGTVPHAAVCVIGLVPTDTTTAKIRKGASSAIEKDGSFDIMTRQPGDGAYYGDYAVTFTVRKVPSEPVSLIQPKYSDPRETPYKLTVNGDKDGLRYEIEPLPGVTGTPAE